MTDTLAPSVGAKGRDPEGHMPLKDHIRELRNRLAIALVAIVVAGVYGWTLYEPIFRYLVSPYREIAVRKGMDPRDFALNFSDVSGAFNLHIKIAFAVGLVIASPVVLYQVWAFVMPGLKKTEKKYALSFLGAAIPLFALGCFAATRVIPIALNFLIGLQPNVQGVVSYTSADRVIDFGVKMILGFGIMFVLPVLLVGLNFLGILPAMVLIKGWRVVVLVIVVLSAMASPSPDAWSMLLLAVPVLFLFGMAMLICYVHDRRKAARSSEPDYSQFSDDEASPVEPDTFDADRDNR